MCNYDNTEGQRGPLRELPLQSDRCLIHIFTLHTRSWCVTWKEHWAESWVPLSTNSRSELGPGARPLWASVSACPWDQSLPAPSQ